MLLLSKICCDHNLAARFGKIGELLISTFDHTAYKPLAIRLKYDSNDSQISRRKTFRIVSDVRGWPLFRQFSTKTKLKINKKWRVREIENVKERAIRPLCSRPDDGSRLTKSTHQSRLFKSRWTRARARPFACTLFKRGILWYMELPKEQLRRRQ